MTMQELPHGAEPGHSHKGRRSFTPAERAALGKQERKRTPRSKLGEFTPAADRADPVELLLEQAQSRVASLIPIRHGRMAATPFAFFRGAALPMAADLASMPRTALTVQLCGDAHLMNFGAFGTPERRLVFDINDFDETSTGPFEWDMMRLVASVVLASRERGDSASITEQAVLGAAAAYRESMAQFAGMGTLDVWYSIFDIDVFMADLSKEVRDRQKVFTRQAIRKIRSRDSLRAAERITTVVDGTPQFVSNPPLQVRGTDLNLDGYSNVLDALISELYTDAGQYRRSLSAERRHLFDEYRIVDVARRVVGVGSVGTRCYVMLLLGRDFSDPLILQIKEAQESVLERFTGPSGFANHGERVVVGQKLTQSASDLFLGWTVSNASTTAGPRHYYLRQFRDWKASIEFNELPTPNFVYYAKVCAWALAKAHARSGDQIAISAYLGNGTVFDRAMLKFANAYADQTMIDHAGLLAAIDDGRVEALSGI